MKKSSLWLCLLGIAVTMLIFPTQVHALDAEEVTNTINGLLSNTGSSDQTINTFIMMTLLSIIPILLVMTTSFTRIIMVLSFVRNALGTQQNPPNQVLIGLALFLTFFVMRPVYTDIYNDAIQPFKMKKLHNKKFLIARKFELKNLCMSKHVIKMWNYLLI
jgi:flagellar biosynthetic protein FliP